MQVTEILDNNACGSKIISVSAYYTIAVHTFMIGSYCPLINTRINFFLAIFAAFTVGHACTLPVQRSWFEVHQVLEV